MTPEEMKFWLDVLKSPAVIAIAGGLAGSLITLVVTILKNRHDSKENEKKWQREEERRKEERAFANKQVAYENFHKMLGGEPSSKMLPALGKLLLYAPYEVKVYARKIIHHISEMDKLDKNSKEYKNHLSNYYICMKNMNTSIVEDIDNHFNQKNTTCMVWEKQRNDLHS